MRPTHVLSAFALIAFALVVQTPSRADDVIPPKVLVRQFPQGQFCALPLSVTFTAPAAPIVIKFTAVEFVPDASNLLTWTEQSIDNVTLAPSAVVAANLAGPPPFGSSENCYIGDPQPVAYFHFNRPALSINLLELFDTDPVARGWDLSNDAFFNPSRSGPRDVETDADLTGGCVGIGSGTGTPSAGSTASVSFTLSGLTAGESYDLGAWWYAGFVRFPHDTNYLTVTITTESGTPVIRKSWGAFKSSLR